jgi:hypothetical protein
VLYEKLTCKTSEYQSKGEEIAKRFIKNGAKELLKRAEDIAMNEVF